MKTAQKSNDLLSPADAAALAGMRRTAFLRYVGHGVEPDAVIGRFKYFRRSTIERWLEQRKAAGIRKRGPKPREQAVA